MSVPDAYHQAAAAVLAAMENGIRPVTGSRYALEDAAAAQSDLEAGKTTGSLLLIP